MLEIYIICTNAVKVLLAAGSCLSLCFNSILLDEQVECFSALGNGNFRAVMFMTCLLLPDAAYFGFSPYDASSLCISNFDLLL